jgi:hypothetical protein
VLTLKPLHLFKTKNELLKLANYYESQVYVIHFSELENLVGLEFFKMSDSAKKAAFELYYHLQLADQSKARAILFEAPISKSDWAGITDRLMKASTIFY